MSAASEDDVGFEAQAAEGDSKPQMSNKEGVEAAQTEADEQSVSESEAESSGTDEESGSEEAAGKEEAEEQVAEEPADTFKPDGPIEALLTRKEATYGLYEYWLIIRDVYLSVDRRTLGFSRILLGFLMVMDLFRRTPDWLNMFSDQGVFPNYFQLLRDICFGSCWEARDHPPR